MFTAPCDVYLSEHDVVQPDVLFVANANLGILQEDGIHGAPDLVIEVLSPATAQLDKKTKRRSYDLAHATGLACHVPRRGGRSQSQSRQLHGAGVRCRRRDRDDSGRNL